MIKLHVKAVVHVCRTQRGCAYASAAAMHMENTDHALWAIGKHSHNPA